MKKKRRKRIRLTKLGKLLATTFVVFFLIIVLSVVVKIVKNSLKEQPYYLAGNTSLVEVIDERGNKQYLTRGILVSARIKTTKYKDLIVHVANYEDKTYYLLDEQLKENREDCVLETNLYSLKNTVLLSAIDDCKISGYVTKNTLLTVLGYDVLNQDGTVNYYKVSYENETGYIGNDYVALEFKESALDNSIYESIRADGGSATLVDYYQHETASFSDNVMPDVVRALYINVGNLTSGKVNACLDIAKNSGINAFVIDIKDCFTDTKVAYSSEVVKKYAPSSTILDKTENFARNVKALKDAGYYIIGRITCFKDVKFAQDHKECSLLDASGNYFRYNGVIWPSAYSRYAWEYNVALACEAVDLFGFNEINFDYIRFPEGINSASNKQNKYNEKQIQAVTEFLRYATDTLHKKHVYVSGDVFGETCGWNSNKCACFVTVYGQFWPAIANTVDVICPMAYPDHYPANSYGVARPWADPYNLTYNYAKAAALTQQITYSPAKNRTWILAQNTSYNNVYSASEVKAQLDGIKAIAKNDPLVYAGFMTWNAASNSNKYRELMSEFK